MARNMIVRLGIDASDFQKKLKQAGILSESFGAKVTKALSNEGFVGARKMVAEMKSIRDAVTSAAEGIDLSQPLSKQIQQAEKEMLKYEEKAEASRKKLRDIRLTPTEFLSNSAKEARVGKILSLQADLSEYKAFAAEARFEFEKLNEVAAQIGTENIKFASHEELKKLSVDIEMAEKAIGVYKETLKDAAGAEQTAAREAGNLGQETGRVRASFSDIIKDFRNIGNFISRLNPIPGIFRRIRDSASGSNVSLEKMVRTIRNVSVVSFGLRLVRGLFGELGTVVRNYISQDEQLQAQVNGLSASLGNVLAPAIRLITSALSYVLPYVVGVSNAIGQLMGALFGAGWSAAASGANKTAAATGSAAKAQKELNRQLMSFDQINRVESQQDTSSGGSGSSSAISPIEAKTPAWAERLKATFTELFESAEFQAANTGGKIGMVLNTAIGEAATALARVDFSGIGSTLAENFNSMIGAINWSRAGQLIGMAIVALPATLVGFAQTADWPLLATSVSEFLTSSLGTVSEWIRSVDWLQLGETLKLFVVNIDYAGIAQSLGTAFGLALGGIGATLWAMIEEPWQEFGKKLRSNMEQFGGDAVAGFFYTLGEGVANIGSWLWDNFCKPIIDGVKEGFGIHSPSKVFGEIGTNCVDSLADRFGEGVVNILQKITDLKSRVTEAAATLKEAFSFEWKLPNLRLPHLSVDWDPVDNVLAQFFGVTAFPRLSVQWFAKGGILDGAQIFGRMGFTLLGGGERGREAILPLDTNTGWMDVLANRIAQSLSIDDGGESGTTINVTLDGEKITSYFIKGLRRRSRAGTTSF